MKDYFYRTFIVDVLSYLWYSEYLSIFKSMSLQYLVARFDYAYLLYLHFHLCFDCMTNLHFLFFLLCSWPALGIEPQNLSVFSPTSKTKLANTTYIHILLLFVWHPKNKMTISHGGGRLTGERITTKTIQFVLSTWKRRRTERWVGGTKVPKHTVENTLTHTDMCMYECPCLCMCVRASIHTFCV